MSVVYGGGREKGDNTIMSHNITFVYKCHALNVTVCIKLENNCNKYDHSVLHLYIYRNSDNRYLS